ncbi:GNAT family N-acetyltransferase [Microvirga sp. 2YAF29]|uniref:GNAT family N-acetyltransferase n=1 Tax=Microvirga sp. 2YAF29 TaxID=3233031 RepID=UPI003F9BB27B
MSDPNLRAALHEDVPAIETLVRNAYSKYIERIGKPPAPMNADYRQLVDEGDVWVLELDGDVVGLMILKLEADHLLVSNVAVSPAHQGRGLGTKLLAHAETQARQRGFGEMRLYTNELMHENLAVYAKLGWSEYDRSEQDGFRRVFLKKELGGIPS